MDTTQQDDDPSGYTWEKNYERSWDALQEDELGNLKSRNLRNANRRAKRKQAEAALTQSVHRGLIRYVYIILDLSRAMEEIDMRPSRISIALQGLKDFIRIFYDENPLSSLGIITSRDGHAERISPLSGSPQAHLRAINGLETGGDFSLQNSLVLALGSLKSIPSHGTKECILITAAVGTTDPGDVFTTITEVRDADVRCSVVSLSAEMYICKLLVDKTKGSYSVARNKTHFYDQFMLCVQPPSKETDGSANAIFTTFVTMGFPSQSKESGSTVSKLRRAQQQQGVVCADTRDIGFAAFYCPQCQAPCSEVPSVCRVCNLPLIAAPHLARSYHHLFPVPMFVDIERGVLETEINTLADDEVLQRQSCFSCKINLLSPKTIVGTETNDPIACECPECNQIYCLTCDGFIHDTLHNCPGCLIKPYQASSSRNGSSDMVMENDTAGPLGSQPIGSPVPPPVPTA